MHFLRYDNVFWRLKHKKVHKNAVIQEKSSNFEPMFAFNNIKPLTMNILVIRFRQMGDAILSTALLNTLRHNFPDAQIHFVLNERIAPLFKGHPSVDRFITFTDDERHHSLTYIRKVWRIVHETHYDIIIDMRSTVNTMLFSLFSPTSKYRIGMDKGYTKMVFNHTIAPCANQYSMVEYDTRYTLPLQSLRPIEPIYAFTLHITDEERQSFGAYLTSQGIDLSRPVMLANVTAKLASKVWMEDRMVWVLSRFVEQYPDYQIIFNYAPGQEEENARRMYAQMGKPQQVFIDVQAHSSRELVAMSSFMTLFFGNEGGARHIAQAAGCPSLAICAPENSKKVWIPQTQVLAEGISPVDTLAAHQLTEQAYQQLSREEKYGLLTQEYVWGRLQSFMQKL